MKYCHLLLRYFKFNVFYFYILLIRTKTRPTMPTKKTLLSWMFISGTPLCKVVSMTKIPSWNDIFMFSVQAFTKDHLGWILGIFWKFVRASSWWEFSLCCGDNVLVYYQKGKKCFSFFCSAKPIVILRKSHEIDL